MTDAEPECAIDEDERKAREAVRKARRGVLVKWLRKTRKRRRTLSTLLMRGWSRCPAIPPTTAC
jgi:hypothetical protein